LLPVYNLATIGRTGQVHFAWKREVDLVWRKEVILGWPPGIRTEDRRIKVSDLYLLSSATSESRRCESASSSNLPAFALGSVSHHFDFQKLSNIECKGDHLHFI
jgi:hypothetical protein